METLLEAAARNLEARPVTDRKPGQIFFMRMKRGSPAKHCGIILNGSEIMHAYSGHKVTITQLTDWWDKLIVAVYDYPGVK
jgi:cell wall-associated NlpC family hydrolase